MPDPSPESSNADRRERARELLADFVRNADEASSHDALLEAHPELRAELALEIRKLDLIHGALQRVGDPSVARAFIGIYCPTCHESVAAESDSRSEHGAAVTTCKACGETFAVVSPRESVGDFTGQRFNRFKLLERIGVGGFGSVWRAGDPSLDRVVALKLPRSGLLTEEDTEAFLREARTAAQLKHANIVRVHDVGQHGDTTFIVSDLIDGVSLAERLAIRAFSPRHAAELCVKIARAMQYAHDEGVVHRDLKPQNILIDETGEPFVTDFGLARREAIDITVTTDGAILGTPAFMAPEQARGQSHAADSRTDVYSLGAILFQLLTGELPFRGNAADVLRQVAGEPAPRLRRLNSHIPADLETICLKCLEKKPERRYARMTELADDLQRWLDRRPIAARPIGTFGTGLRWCQRKPALATVTALLALAVILGLAGVTWQLRKTETALERVREERDRADNNKQQSWDLIQEFLVDLSEKDLIDQPGMEEVRANLLERARKHFERLSTENVEDSKSQIALAKARSMLGGLIAEHGDFKAGIALINQALESLFSMEGAGTSKALQQRIVLTLVARGQLAAMARDPSLGADAVENFQQALERVEVLVIGYPENREFRRWHADILAKLGWQYRNRRDPQAVPTLLAAIDVCHDLKQYPDDEVYALEWLGKCHTDLAEYYLARDEMESGINQAQFALQAVREGLELAPDDVDLRSTFCAASHSLGVALLNSNRPTEAIPVFETAIEQRGRLADEFPKTQYFPSHQATLTYFLASAHRNVGRYQKAQGYLHDAVELRRKLQLDFPDGVANRADLAGTMAALADAQITTGAYEEALATAAEALDLLEGLPDSLMNDVNRSLLFAAKSAALIEANRAEEALTASEEAIAAADRFLEQNDSDPQLTAIRVSVVADRINALQKNELHEKALAEMEQNLASAAAALELSSSDSRASGQSFFAVAGSARLAAGETDRAIEWLEMALRDRSVPNPKATAWMDSLIESYDRAGRTEDAQRWRDVKSQASDVESQPTEDVH